MLMRRQRRHDGIDKDLHGEPNILWIVGLPSCKRTFDFLLSFLPGPRLHLLGQGLAVPKAKGLHFANPPLVRVDFDVMPSAPSTIGHENQGRLAQCGQVVLHPVQAHVFDKLHVPHGVVRFRRPPKDG